MTSKDRTVSLADRYYEQIKWSAFVLVLVLISTFLIEWNPVGFTIGVIIGTVVWPLVFHLIGLGESSE